MTYTPSNRDCMHRPYRTSTYEYVTRALSARVALERIMILACKFLLFLISSFTELPLSN